MQKISTFFLQVMVRQAKNSYNDHNDMFMMVVSNGLMRDETILPDVTTIF